VISWIRLFRFYRLCGCTVMRSAAKATDAIRRDWKMAKRMHGFANTSTF
jgi:hypothetical protein